MILFLFFSELLTCSPLSFSLSNNLFAFITWLLYVLVYNTLCHCLFLTHALGFPLSAMFTCCLHYFDALALFGFRIFTILTLATSVFVSV